MANAENRTAGWTAFRISFALNVVLAIALAGYILYQPRPWRPDQIPRLVYSSTSPDGKWRCTVADINPLRGSDTIVYSVERVDALPLSGTQYVSFEDSNGPFEPTFEWSNNQLILVDMYKTLQADFDDRYQHWRRLPRAGDPDPAPFAPPAVERP